MFFLVDTKMQAVTAHKKLGEAARHALALAVVPLSEGADPVKAFNQLEGQRFVILNLSGAFESISDSDDQAAQELAKQFQHAVDTLYER